MLTINQTLLVSAPTSGGQNNSAMLMVLREQWNNLEGGMIRKDQFKIDQLIS